MNPVKLVAIVDKFITKKSTMQEIVRAMTRTCELFPSSFQEICVQLVEAYGKDIVRILATLVFSPQQVCTVVRCCGWVAQPLSPP